MTSRQQDMTATPRPEPLLRTETTLRRPVRRLRRLGTALVCAAALLSAEGGRLLAQPAAPAAPAARAARAEGGLNAGPQPLPPSKDPVVNSILENKTNDPVLLFRNLEALVDLQQGAYGAPLVAKLAALPWEDAESARVYREIGGPTFAKLQLDGAPAGASDLAKKIAAAARKVHTSPKQIGEWIGKLSDPSPTVVGRNAARLRYSGAAAVDPLLAKIAAEPDAALRRRYAEALANLQDDAAAPAMVAALQSTKGPVAAAAAFVLGRLQYTRALPYLVRPAYAEGVPGDEASAAVVALQQITGRSPRRETALEQLRQYAKVYHSRAYVYSEAQDGTVVVWDWNDAKQQAVPRTISTNEASVIAAARLSSDWLKFEPENETALRMNASARIEALVLKHGIEQPLEADDLDSLKSIPKERVLALLKANLSEEVLGRRPILMLGAVRLLGATGDAKLLERDGEEFAPLVRAALCGNRRVRIAAAEEVFRLSAGKLYPGSSLLMEMVAAMTYADGRPRAIVADNHRPNAEAMAAFLTQLGWKVEVVYTGRDMIRLALQQPELELVLVGQRLDYPQNTPYAIAQLRKDARTADLPVGIVASLEDQARAERTAAVDSYCEVFVRPQKPEQVRSQLQRLTTRGRAADYVPPAERLEQGKRAMALITGLPLEAERVYDLHRIEGALVACLYSSESSVQASEVLGRIHTASAQKSLVDFVGASPMDVELRRAAAKAFTDSVERFGTMLAASEVLRQFDRFNETEPAAKNDQELLGAILDAIEKRAKKQASAAPAPKAAPDADAAKPEPAAPPPESK